MKQLTNYLITSILLLAGCNTGNSIRDFIPGMYATNYKHEYATGTDTITIEPFGNNGYSITRHTSFRRITASDTGKTEHTFRKYSGIYKPDTRTVLETTRGTILSFDPANKYMKWGITLYRKIN